jgi:hypothetical protein
MPVFFRGVLNMGTIMLKVPEDIHLEYQFDSLKMMAPLLEWLKNSKQTKQQIENKDKLLGLFADDAELIDQITESAMQARENHPLKCDNG